MFYTYDDYLRAAQAIRQKTPLEPEFLLILGSGLGFLGDLAEGAAYIPYEEIPGFRASTAPGGASGSGSRTAPCCRCPLISYHRSGTRPTGSWPA